MPTLTVTKKKAQTLAPRTINPISRLSNSINSRNPIEKYKFRMSYCDDYGHTWVTVHPVGGDSYTICATCKAAG